MLRMWPSIVTCLADIKRNRNIWKEGADRAKYLYDYFINADFLLHIFFKYDLMLLFEQESLKLQQKRGTVMGKRHFRDALLAALAEFKRSNRFPGFSQTYHMLHEALCSEGGTTAEDEMEPCDTTERYEAAKKIIFRDVQLLVTGRTRHRHRHQGEGKQRQRNTEIPGVSTVKDEIVDELTRQMRSYFPDEIGDFDIFLPQNLPQMLDESTSHGAEEIIDLANLYNLESLTIATQWKDLLAELIADPYFIPNVNDGDPALFWVHYLINERHTVSWRRKDELKWLICVALALPASSADAERGFSYLTHTKFDRRSSLSDTTLRNIMRVRANGPRVEKFDAKFYATQWMRESHQSAADNPTGPKKKEASEDLEWVSESALY